MLWLVAGLSLYSIYVAFRTIRDVRAIRDPVGHIEWLIKSKPLPELVQFVPDPPRFDPKLSSLPEPVLQGLHGTNIRKAYGEYQAVRRAIDVELGRLKLRLDAIDQAFLNAVEPPLTSTPTASD